MREKIYISGKITNEPFFVQKFKATERYLKHLGYKVYNPVKLISKKNKPWEWYMKKDIKILLKCDSIYLIPDWSYSNGAKTEYNLASSLGYKIITGKWEDLVNYGFDILEK